MPPSAFDRDRLDLAQPASFHRDGGLRRAAIHDYVTTRLTAAFHSALEMAGVGSSEGMALAVVGSQARGEAGPLSDVDVVLLHDGRRSAARNVERVADALWYPMWDAGIRIDHSVRTPAQCRQVASEDLTAAVGLLDLTVVAGDAELVAETRASVATDWRGAARRRLPELVASLEERHRRFGSLASAQVPDLKEAAGGLRDLHLVPSLTIAWLADPPRGPLAPARETLLDVRDALHVVTRNPRTRLTQQDQSEVAALLGLHDADELLTRVVDAGRTVSFGVEAALRAAQRAQRARRLRVGPRRPDIQPLEYGLGLHDGEVVLTHKGGTGGQLMLMRACSVAARLGVRVSPTTLANLTADLPDLPRPWPDETRGAFIEFLAAGPGVVAVWEALDRCGAVDLWLPEWASVRSRPQRNAVHRYTVDRHLVETVVAAQALRVRVARPDLLLLAALLHDIGKVSGASDHSREGAPVARRIVDRMGWGQDNAEVVELLVREHLTLVDLATTRDVEDPATVAAVREAVGNRAAVLDLLEALTEADARATGTRAWTAWRAGLVASLGRAAHDSWCVGPSPTDPEQHVAVHPRWRDAVAAGDVVVDVCTGSETATVTAVSADRPGLFADLAGVLAVRRLRVVSATFRTVEEVAIGQFVVETPTGQEVDDDALRRAVRALHRGDRTPLRTLEAPTAPTAARGEGPGTAFVVPGASASATVVEVRAQDRRGLLFDLGRVFAAQDIRVRSAHVATYAAQSADTFYLTDPDGSPLDPGRVAQLLDALRGPLATPVEARTTGAI